MPRLRIAPAFFQQLRSSRALSDDAFISACGLTPHRYKELESGAEPTMLEICKITSGFKLTDGIPMSVTEAPSLAATATEAVA